ncbi:hypothetical protein RJ641_017080 [Dillenia turbinata]|uniref:Uncharacterized protein n=1 Tax=Dillenia turbinata TaxID=194707 RepID=A0AAN8UZJ9_9MAGN
MDLNVDDDGDDCAIVEFSLRRRIQEVKNIDNCFVFFTIKSRSHIYLPVVICVAVLVLLQLYIIALSRIPPQVVVLSLADHMTGMGNMLGEKPEATAWLEKTGSTSQG